MVDDRLAAELQNLWAEATTETGAMRGQGGRVDLYLLVPPMLEVVEVPPILWRRMRDEQLLD